MRLIDADALIERLKMRIRTTRSTMEIIRDIIPMVEKQPTAYDLDKVVGQLEGNSQNIALVYDTDDGIDYTEDVGLSLNKAIEIVKKGGK